MSRDRTASHEAALALGRAAAALRAEGHPWKEVCRRLRLCRTQVYEAVRKAEKRPKSAKK